MNSFFRICIYYCIGLLVFTLLFNLIATTEAFDMDSAPGIQVQTTEEALGEFTTLATPNMGYIFGLVAFGAATGLFLSYITRSIIPLGISIFGTVFWASFIHSHSIMSMGGFVPVELLTILTVATVLVFVAAIIGMITGSV